MQRLRDIMRWCRRYMRLPVILGLSFVAFMLFFNDNSLSHSVALKSTIDSLRHEIQAMHDTAAYYQDLNRRLDTDPQTMERVVREHYNMKRPHEDVFVFTNDNE